MGERWPRDKWQAAVWADPMLKPNEKLVAQAFAFRAFEKDTVWATYEDLKTMTGLARSSIAIARKGLEEAGWLAQVKGAYYHQAPVFRLTYPLGRLLDETGQGVHPGHTTQGAESTPDTVPGDRGPGDGPHGVRETDGWGPGAGPINSPKNSPKETHFSAPDHAGERGPTRKRSGADVDQDFVGAVEFMERYAGYDPWDATEFVTLLQKKKPKQRSLLAFLRSLENAGTLDGFIGGFYARGSGVESDDGLIAPEW